MHQVDELKRFALRHAPAQGISQRRCGELFARIRTDDRGLPGSWVWEWRREAEILERQGRLLDAYKHYNMARFPYVDGGARQYAMERALSVFGRWRQANPGIQRIDVHLAGGKIGCWAYGLSSINQNPLLLAMDGIVNTKERWIRLLAYARRLGMAAVVTEMPGVGENTLRYDAESWQMLPAVLDAVSGLADVTQTYAVTYSFGGHLALRCAAADQRIQGVIAVSAPVTDFFSQVVPRRRTSHVVLDTLAHISRAKAEQLDSHLHGLALTEHVLAEVRTPVYYVAARQDEIIPVSEVSFLRRHLRHLHVIETDDVHGSPALTTENGLWTAFVLLRMRGVRNPRRSGRQRARGSRRHQRRSVGSQQDGLRLNPNSQRELYVRHRQVVASATGTWSSQRG